MTTPLVIRGFKHLSREQRNYPLNDAEAWTQTRGVMGPMFDRLWLTLSQNILCGPHGTAVPSLALPAWSRPVQNLAGELQLGRVLQEWTPADYRPAWFWTQMFPGIPFLLDLVVVRGEPVWHYATRLEMDEGLSVVAYHGRAELKDHEAEMMLPPSKGAKPIPSNQVQAEMPRFDDLMRWVSQFLPTYTGALSLLVVRERILELHLHPTVELTEWWGEGWLTALWRLYQAVVPAEGTVDVPVFPVGRPCTVYAHRMMREFGRRYRVDLQLLQSLALQKLWLAFTPPDEVLEDMGNDERTYLLGVVGDSSPVAALEGFRSLQQACVPLEPPAAQGLRPPRGVRVTA